MNDHNSDFASAGPGPSCLSLSETAPGPAAAEPRPAGRNRFGHASAPTRNYRYGALEPTHNLDLVREHMAEAHHYRNALAQIECWRRDRYHQALESLHEPVGAARLRVEELRRALEESRAAIRRENSLLGDAAWQGHGHDEAAGLREGLSAAFEALRRAEAEARRLPEAGALLHAIDEDALAAGRAHRIASGLSYGTYLLVDESASRFRKGPPPRRAGWDGSGHLGVQLQGGLAVSAALAGADTRFRLEALSGPPGWREPLPRATPGSNSRHARWFLAWLRLGTSVRFEPTGEFWKRGPRAGEEKLRRVEEPVWAKVPVCLSEKGRPLPADAQIKWVHLHRRRVGLTSEWSLTLTLSRAEGFPSRAGGPGLVGIDLGWRLRGDGSLRVAYAVGLDASGRHYQELVIPARDVDRWRNADDRRSRRDRNFDRAREALAAWLASHPHPDWLRARTLHLPQWRSPAQMAAVVLCWREARFPGDEAIFPEMESWRRHDRHHLEREANLRRKAQAWRENLYRSWVARLRERFGRCAVEDANWRDLARLPEAEDAQEVNETARHLARVAAPGRLAQIVKEVYGGDCAAAPAENTTRRCHACGAINDWDQAAFVYHVCESCGVGCDQDQGAAINLLRWLQGGPPAGPGAVA